MPRRQGEGTRLVYNTGFVLNLISLCLQFIAFVSPYWFQSWPRVHSPFKKIGLWEACFAGLILHRDPTEKAYHGCWWILAPEYWHIQRWLMPWWFVITQVACTIALVVQIVNVIVGLVVWVTTMPDYTSSVKKRPPIGMIQLTTVLTIVEAICMSLVVILFGCAVYIDRVWMPRPDLNYLSWSYGLEVVGAFFLIFSSIALGCYSSMVRQELREPPSLTAPMVSMGGGNYGGNYGGSGAGSYGGSVSGYGGSSTPGYGGSTTPGYGGGYNIPGPTPTKPGYGGSVGGYSTGGSVGGYGGGTQDSAI